MNRIVKSSLLSLLLALCVLALAACQSAPAVTSIEVTTQPAKTEYKLGEELTLEGGQLTVSYSDKTPRRLRSRMRASPSARPICRRLAERV